MRGPIEAGRFEEMSGLPPEDLAEYRKLKLLDPDQDGDYDAYDVLRLMLIRVYTEQGIEPEKIREHVMQFPESSGWIAARVFNPGGRTYTVEEASRAMGVELEKFEAISNALGLTGSQMDENDLATIKRVAGTLMSVLPWEAILEGARVYGDAMRRIAEAEVRMMHHYFCEQLAKDGYSEAEIALRVSDSVRSIEGVIFEFIEHLHQDFLVRATIDHAFTHLEAGIPSDLPGSFEATIAFVDLSLFTSLAEVHGDETAASILDRVDQHVRALVGRHMGNLVKQIGDEFMVTFAGPVEAVRFASDLEDALASDENIPSPRIGIHTGPVLYRVGDYVGHTVNVASRVVSMAMPNTILITEPVALAARGQGIEVESVGVRRARGIEEPLALYRVVKPAVSKERDPVCGMLVEAPGAGRVSVDQRDYFFCSTDCVKRFLEDPTRYSGAA